MANDKNPQAPAPKAPAPVEKQATPVQTLSSPLEEIVRQQSEQIAGLQQQLNLLLRQQLNPQAPVSSGDMLAQDIQKAKQREEEKQTFMKWVAIPSAVRTQQICDEKYTDGHYRFRVRLKGKMDKQDDFGRPHPQAKEIPTGCPEIEINAHSEEEAKGRYEKLCGITAVKDGPTWLIDRIGVARQPQVQAA